MINELKMFYDERIKGYAVGVHIIDEMPNGLVRASLMEDLSKTELMSKNKFVQQLKKAKLQAVINLSGIGLYLKKRPKKNEKRK